MIVNNVARKPTSVKTQHCAKGVILKVMNNKGLSEVLCNLLHPDSRAWAADLGGKRC